MSYIKPHFIKRIFLGLIIFALMLVAFTHVGNTLAVSDTTPTHSTVQQGGIPSATANIGVNVLAGPTPSFWIVGFLARFETVPILGVSQDRAWWYISGEFGEGWVPTSAVTATNTATVQVRDPGTIITITGSLLNVRGAPGEEAILLGRLSAGQQVYLIGRSGNNVWLNIEWQYGTGWVAARYTSVGDAAPTTPADTVEDTPVTEAAPFAVVNAYALNVRSGPGTNFTIVGTVTGGERLPIIGQNADGSWYNVQTVVGEGWIAARYVITRNEFGNAPLTTDTVVVSPQTTIETTIIINTGSLNVRTGPGAEYTILTTVRGGDEFPVLARNRAYTWLQIQTPAGIGWVNWSYIISRSSLSNLPLADATAPVTVTNPTTGQSVQVTTEPSLIGPIAFVATGALNIRSGPNISFPSLGSVNSTTRMSIVGQSLDRRWWQVDSPFGLGWVNKNYVYVEGNVSNVPVVQ